MTTLYDHVMRFRIYQCNKHNLHPSPDEYAEQDFNKLTPADQLREISDALEELFPFWMRQNHE